MEFFEKHDLAAAILLYDLPLWRLRAIERVQLSQAFWSERERIIHVHPLREAMARDTNPETPIRNELVRLGAWAQPNIELVLPITELPKVPLLDMDINVNQRPVFRVSKDDGARIQACYLLKLAQHAGLTQEDDHPEHFLDFLTFIFFFPWYSFERTRNIFTPSILSPPDYAYLISQNEEIEEYQKLDIPAFYSQWRRIVKRIKKISGDYVLGNPISGSQNPLLSLPYFFQELRDRARTRRNAVNRESYPCAVKITELLTHLERLLSDAHEKGLRGDLTAKRFVSDYFSYGYRWMVFARCVVPTNEPFTIKVREKRAIYFTAHAPYQTKHTFREHLRKEAWQNLAFADAETNHVSIRVSDVAVRIKHPQALDEQLNPLDDKHNSSPHYPDEEKSTSELYTRQDSKRGRPERIYIKCPLRLTRVQSGMLWLTIIITAFAWVLLLVRGMPTLHPHDVPNHGAPESTVGTGLTAKDATLILVPIAFAATLLLSKVDSTLGAWVRRIRHTVLIAELFLLLATAFLLILVHHVKAG